MPPSAFRVLGPPVALTWLMTLLLLAVRPGGLLDLAVYRAGSQRLLDGGSIYAQPYGDLPFTYPPFAALVMVPFAVLPTLLAEVAVPLLSSAALVLVWHHCGVGARGLLLVAPASALLEPVWMTQHFGQVNLLLLALVLGDLVGPTSRWRGALTGIAAGIKLTPLVFLAHLVATGQWRAAGVMTASFAATVLVPVVLIPGDGTGFWTEVLPDAERIGASWYAGNQSLMGVVARVGGDSPWVRPAWFVASVVMVLGALRLARSLHVRSDPLAAVSVTGLASLLASPVSWSHHWVWCIPLGVVALRHVGRPAALLWTACFIASPHRWVPTGRDRELAWTWEHVPGDAYVWLGLLWLGRAAWLTAGATPGRQSVVPPRVTSGGRRRRGGTARAVSSVTRSARSEGTRSIPRKRRAVRQGLQGPRAPGGLVLPAADSAAQLRQCDGAVTSGALDPSQ